MAKRIKALSLVTTTSKGDYDLAYVVGSDKVTGIIDNPDVFLVLFGENVIRGFMKKDISIFEVELEEFTPVEEKAKPELVIPKKQELITPDGKVIDLSEARKSKKKE